MIPSVLTKRVQHRLLRNTDLTLLSCICSRLKGTAVEKSPDFLYMQEVNPEDAELLIQTHRIYVGKNGIGKTRRYF